MTESSIFISFVNVIWELLKGIFDLVVLIFDSLTNGIAFFITTMSKLPSFLIDLFYTLPTFIRIGLGGVFGLLIFVVIFKIIVLIREATI